MTKHTWAFQARFRSGAYGWKSSKLAAKRAREAVSEIKAVRRKDPLLAAEGAVRFIERVVPAIEKIDSSSGAIATAINKAINTLLDLIIGVDADAETREAWVDRIWQATMDDGYGYLDQIPDRWGEVCGSAALAGRWADDMAPMLRRSWKQGGYLQGGTAAPSCLLAAGRPEEVLDLLEAAPYAIWDNQRHGVQALVDLGRHDDAIAYAETKSSPDDVHQVASTCERILRDQGRMQEAYERYALEAHRRGTYLATYRSLAKAYPDFTPQKLLKDLVDATPGVEGKWFATAKALGEYDLAIELANRTSCEPSTLIRAARDFETKDPLFALNAGLTALRWLCEGYGYELDGSEVHSAFAHAMAAAENIGQREVALQAMTRLITPEYSGEAWSRSELRRMVIAARGATLG